MHSNESTTAAKQITAIYAEYKQIALKTRRVKTAYDP